MKTSAYFLIIGLLCGATPSHATGRVVHADPTDYRTQLNTLGPGDTLQLAPGEYRRGLPIHYMLGASHAPIVIRGPAPPEKAIFVARAHANTVSIVNSAYVEIRNLTLDGRDIPVDGVKAEGYAHWAHHITIENVTIINHGASQGNVGISTKCPAWGWIIRGNRIHGAGTGMYLGNSDGTRAFYDGLIENNLVTNPLGYAIQIKHQRLREAVAVAPQGRFFTRIRHNVLSKVDGGSSGPDARPNLLVGHWPPAGEGAHDEYLIYGNFLYDNPHEALFQGEGNIAFYDNVLVNPHGPGVHIQPHNDVPRNVRILHNTIMTSGSPLSIVLKAGQPKYQQIVAGNAIFSPIPATGGVQLENVQFNLEMSAELLQAAGDRLGRIDPYPQSAQMRCAALDSRLLEGLIDANCDFNGEARTQGYCGAYAGEGRNPGWRPSLTIKPRTVCRAR